MAVFTRALTGASGWYSRVPFELAGKLPVPPRRSLLTLLMLMCCAGCPEAQHVTVTIKPVVGGGGAASGDATAETTAAAGFGNLVGTVTFDGSAPNLQPLVAQGDATAKDAAVCAAAAVPDESLVVNSANKGIANVVVYLEKRPGNIKPELAKPPETPVMFDQKGCRFLPHLITVQIGQPLLVISDDPVPHNTSTNPKRNDKFNKVIAPNDRSGVPCEDKKPEPEPVLIKCDYHPWMSAFHFPLDHPYVAVTDGDGKFKIEGLPAGKHTFNVWQERGKYLDRKVAITIEVDKDTTKDFTYGSAKFAVRNVPAPRAVAYERLLSGGEITVSQTEGQR